MPATLDAPAPPVRTLRPGGSPPRPAIPPLENGDCLQAPEFLRRYEAMPEHVKAELIDGQVYIVHSMASPVAHTRHGRPHTELSFWIMSYRAATPGVDSGDNSTVELDLDNMPQPDLLMFIPRNRGGRAWITDDDHVDGAPDLACEVSNTSIGYDLNQKLDVYRRNGVREYVVWRTAENAIDYFALQGDRYERLTAGGDGLIRSEVFPGLWLDAAALLRGDLAAVADAVRRGTSTPEHAAFAARVKP